MGGEAYQFPGNERYQWSTYIAASFDLSILTKFVTTTVGSLVGQESQ